MHSPFFKWIGRALMVVSVCMIGAASGSTHFTLADSQTGVNMTVVIQTSINPTINGHPLAIGDEIGVFNSSGLCYGLQAWTGQNIAIAVWGYDQISGRPGMMSGDTLHFRVWDPALGEGPATVTYNTSSPGVNADSIFMASGEALAILASLTGHAISAVLPVPVGIQKTGDFTLQNGVLSYSLQQPAKVELVIYDLRGRVALTINQRQAAGRYTIALKSFHLSSGPYIARFNTAGLSRSKVFTITE